MKPTPTRRSPFAAARLIFALASLAPAVSAGRALAQQPAGGAASAASDASPSASSLNPLTAGTQSSKAIRINDQIYQAAGFGNTFMVITSEGNVIIDTSLSLQAPRHKKLLQAISAAPVKKIILTHGHEDHTGGVKLWREAGTEVIAQREITEFLSYSARLAGIFAIRNGAQFGGGLGAVKAEKEGAGDRASALADILFDEEYEFKQGGLTFHIFHTPGETYEHATVWIPELKAAFVGDNYYTSFPNMYTLRGCKPRWALDYIHSLEKIMSLKPEILLPSHGLAVEGADKIQAELTKYRDAIAYVHEATLKGMNEGKDVYTLMREVKLPAALDVGEGYGRVAWSVRGIYEGYVGWFDGDPAHMFEWSESVAHPELVKMAGGAEAVGKRAQELVDSGDAMQGLQLAGIALNADPKSPAALGARLAAFEALAKASRNFNEKNWINYGIRETKAKLAGAPAAR